MNKALRIAAASFGASALIVLLAAGCGQSQQQKSGIREWTENKDGVEYNKTCIEGMLFIATPGSHGEISLAGPIGSCR